MVPPVTDLFDPVVQSHRFNPLLKKLREWPGSEPARLMINEVFSTFEAADKNFVEQFQTNGFDARIFELYLYAYFSQSGYVIERVKERPDFLITRNGLTVAVEATTANPTQQSIPEIRETQERVTVESGEFRTHTDQEAVMKLGSALFSKLQKQYWKLDHCEGRPLVFAIQAFYSDTSLYQSESSLADYLYGIRQQWTFPQGGVLQVKNETVNSHQLGKKTIPSNFFAQPGAENVGAIVFSNSGTWAKFGRMGYQAGYHRGNLAIKRHGFYFNPDPNSTTPLEMTYDLREPPFEETWGQGLVVLHNPNAVHPIPKDFFADASQVYWEDGQLPSRTPANHPFMSQTMIIVNLSPEFAALAQDGRTVGTILRAEFERFNPQRGPLAELTTRERVWYANEPTTIIGTVIKDATDDEYNWVLLGRDERDKYRCVDVGDCYQTQLEAQRALRTRMDVVAATAPSCFPQGD